MLITLLTHPPCAQWSKRKKLTILFLVSIYSFLSNGALFGPSVYVNYLAELFQKTPNETSRLVTYPNLLFGFGEIHLVHHLSWEPNRL